MIGNTIQLTLSLFSVSTIFLLGYYIFLKDSKRAVNRLFFLMSIAATLWGIMVIGIVTGIEEKYPFILDFIGWIGLAFLASFFLHLCLLIVESKNIEEKKIFLILLYLPSLIVFGTVFSFVFFPMPVEEETVEKYFNLFFGTYFELCLVISVFVLFKRYFSLKSSQERAKLRNFIIGALIPIVPGTIFTMIPTTFRFIFPEISEFVRTFWSGVFTYYLFAIGYFFVARGVLQYGLFIDYREILETIFKRLAELVIVTDREGLILLTNEITLEKLDFKEEEIKGKRITDLLEKEKWREIKEKLKKEVTVLEERIYFKTKRKDKIPFLLAISKTKEGIIFVGRDIKEIVSYQEKLEEEVKERTKELKEAKTILEVKVKARTKELEELAQSLEEKVKERTKELQERVDELERFHKLTVGRELKMIELKKEIERLKRELDEKR